MHLYTTIEAARYLGGTTPLSQRTLEAWRVTGDGPRYVKIGRLVRYEQQELDAWLDRNRVRSTSQITAIDTPQGGGYDYEKQVSFK